MVGGLKIIEQQTDDQEEGLGYLWTPAEVLSAVYPDSELQGSFICQVEWRDREMRSQWEGLEGSIEFSCSLLPWPLAKFQDTPGNGGQWQLKFRSPCQLSQVQLQVLYFSQPTSFYFKIIFIATLRVYP